MKENPRVAAVIVAAGNSTRMSMGISKQLIPLLGLPAIGHTLLAFENAQSIQEVVVVCRKSDMSAIEDITEKLSITKLRGLALGGATRSESVEAGVRCVSEQTTHLAIHDGARALVSREEIDRVVSFAIEHRAATLAVPVTD
ncbi:MAG: 2-C-methyl-D-erythritol 4-phosphate cytidylyltransferase, partial [Ruminococcus sp.]